MFLDSCPHTGEFDSGSKRSRYSKIKADFEVSESKREFVVKVIYATGADGARKFVVWPAAFSRGKFAVESTTKTSCVRLKISTVFCTCLSVWWKTSAGIIDTFQPALSILLVPTTFLSRPIESIRFEQMANFATMHIVEFVHLRKLILNERTRAWRTFEHFTDMQMYFVIFMKY